MAKKKISKTDSKNTALVPVEKTEVKFDANWMNQLTNIGVVGRDKRMAGVSNALVLGLTELDISYQSDDLVARIIDRVPEEMFREGYEICLEGVNEEDKFVAALVNELAEHDVNQKLETGEKYGRLYGGAGLYVGVNDGLSPEEPLDLSKIRSVDYVTLFDRFELVTASGIDRNVRSKNFGKPEFYRLATIDASQDMTIKIHNSRILRFEGAPLPRRIAASFDYWDQSILNRIYLVLMNYHTSNDAVASIIQDFTRLVLKMQELAGIVSMGPDGDKILQKRLELVAQTNSILNAIIIRADEEVTEQGRQVNGLSDLMKVISSRLVAATDIPHTILFGESPSGLGASGDSEKRDFYDHVKNLQKSRIEPKLKKLIKIFMAAKVGAFQGAQKDFTIQFKPLWQMDEKQLAEIRWLQAQADDKYIANQTLLPEEVAESRFGSGKYSTETKLNADLRSRIEKELPAEVQNTTEPSKKTGNGMQGIASAEGPQ